MAHRGPKQLPRAERFWGRVQKTDGCWVWAGAVQPLRGGYGNFYDDDTRRRRAHRVSWELTYGEIPAGMDVCHRCDNPPCVRPAHLFLGSQDINLADMRAKGRTGVTTSRGEMRYNAKLTDDLVRWIRRESKRGATALAAELGVGRNTVRSVLAGESWRHVV